MARAAGVSTKTLYRLIPTKAALFGGTVSGRPDRSLSEVDLQAIDHADIDEALVAALVACAVLVLDACAALVLRGCQVRSPHG